MATAPHAAATTPPLLCAPSPSRPWRLTYDHHRHQLGLCGPAGRPHELSGGAAQDVVRGGQWRHGHLGREGQGRARAEARRRAHAAVRRILATLLAAALRLGVALRSRDAGGGTIGWYMAGIESSMRRGSGRHVQEGSRSRRCPRHEPRPHTLVAKPLVARSTCAAQPTPRRAHATSPLCRSDGQQRGANALPGRHHPGIVHAHGWCGHTVPARPSDRATGPHNSCSGNRHVTIARIEQHMPGSGRKTQRRTGSFTNPIANARAGCTPHLPPDVEKRS